MKVFEKYAFLIELKLFIILVTKLDLSNDIK